MDHCLREGAKGMSDLTAIDILIDPDDGAMKRARVVNARLLESVPLAARLVPMFGAPARSRSVRAMAWILGLLTLRCAVNRVVRASSRGNLSSNRGARLGRR
jgi:hypothetical protein